jgi:peroxiredoxin Q/BCP
LTWLTRTIPIARFGGAAFVMLPSMGSTMPVAGNPAPDFQLSNQDGEPVRLSDLRGRRVVLYFYPKADTPGCTTQACGVRDHRADYETAGAVVLGVSADPVASIKRFQYKHGLGFTLLADEDHAVAGAYGTWVEKSRYGKRSMGVQRATFVIDENGVVRHVIPKASPTTHDDEVLAALSELGQRGAASR